MRVLVTGATGFVGQTLCRSLQSDGYEVWALSRQPDKATQRVPAIEKAFPWQPLDAEPPASALDGVDAVIHLAGESVNGRWDDAKKQAIRESRLVGTAHLIAAIRRRSIRPQVLISGSAIGYYGDRGDQELTEDARPGDDFLARTCVEWEETAGQAADLGVRTVYLRTGIVLDQGGGALAEIVKPAKLGLNGPLGSGRQWWSWIHRQDVAGLIGFAIQHEDLSGPVNATAPGVLRQKEFAQVLGRVIDRPSFLPAPAIALRIALGEFAVELLSSRRVIPTKASQAGYSFQYPDLDAALRAALS